MPHRLMPDIGFGTWPLRGDEARAAIRMALDVGFRHIDTAQMYGNETEVGEVLADCGSSQAEIYLTTKVDPSNASPARLVDSVRRSLDLLRRDRVDLLLLHWPPRNEPLQPQLQALASAQELGLTEHIGVSNFTRAQLREAASLLGDKVALNQVEFHPAIDQESLLVTAGEVGVPLMAYSPLARGRALELPAVLAAAAAHGRTPSQIVLRWILQRGLKLVVMTTKPDRARENFRCTDFALSDGEMANIGAERSRKLRVVSPPQFAPQWD